MPQYSLVRQSCTATNQDWFQTTLPEDEAPIPQWAEDVGQRTVRRIPLARALRGKDIDSDDSDDDEMMDPEQYAGGEELASDGPGADIDVSMQQQQQPDGGGGSGAQRLVHPRRFRLWGLAASPGDGCTAAVVSKYNTQHPNRRDRAEVVFGWYVPPEGGEAAAGTRTLPARATTEARVWEWMYGRGAEVPGTTNATDILSLASSMSALRQQFRAVLPRVHCVFCDAPLREEGAEAICDRGHSFGTFPSFNPPPPIEIGLMCNAASNLRFVGHAHHGAGYIPRLRRLRAALPADGRAGQAGRKVSRPRRDARPVCGDLRWLWRQVYCLGRLHSLVEEHVGAHGGCRTWEGTRSHKRRCVEHDLLRQGDTDLTNGMKEMNECTSIPSTSLPPR